MAEMYPPYMEQSSDNGALGEALVYRELAKLPDDWVVIHDYWRYYLGKKDTHVNYELDFIVLVPGKGFVVIEVKNWYAAEVRQGEWWFMARKGQYIKMEHKLSPLHQAYLGAKKLNSELCQVRRFADWYTSAERRGGRVEFHGLAVLLNQTAEELLPLAESVEKDAACAQENAVPLRDLYICGEDSLKDNLQARIEKLFSKDPRKQYLPLEPKHIKQIVSYLLPSFHLKGDPASFNRILEDATASVHSLLPMLESCHGGISVTGCAGSGKTWIAVREISRLYALHGASKRILFLCYNAALAEHMRRLPELHDGVASGVVDVFPFPSLCQEIVRTPFADRAEQRAWFLSLHSEHDLSAVADVLHKLRPEHRYDYIFIDECQDFQFSWGFVVTALRKLTTKIYYFSDDNQNIFVQGASRGFLPPTPTQIRLRRNLRNSAEIARFSSAMLSREHRMLPLDAPGLKVEIYRASEDVHERARLVSFWIDRLLHGSSSDRGERRVGVRPHQIVVLSPYASYKMTEQGEIPSPKCALPLVPRVSCRRPGCSAESLLSLWETDESIVMGTTIRAFKGLEADYVILVDVDSPLADDKALTQNDLYVACTRAKYGLVIIPRTVAGELYARSLQSAES